MASLVELSPDERRLIDVVREIKCAGSGFGEFEGTIKQKEIVTIKQVYTHKLS